MKILFICTGNTCRSPMAEHLLKHKAPEMEVKSAGIFAMENQHANENAILAMKEQDIHMDHRSQPVSQELLNWADLVLTMTVQHKHSLMIEFPHFQQKYYTLKEYVSPNNQNTLTELTKAYAQLEEKRTKFLQENEQKYSVNKLNELMMNKFNEEITKIQRLEADIIDGDIADPFGGNLHVYQKTLQELKKFISKLVKK